LVKPTKRGTSWTEPIAVLESELASAKAEAGLRAALGR
jgi:hypothetical protein